jgi:ATP-dependent RNA helicase SUPV3L1/SUV3
MVNAEVTASGELSLEGQIVGRLQGFRFTPEANAADEPVKLDAPEIATAIAQEFEVRANRLSEAVDSALVLANDGAIRWLGDPIAKIAAGDKLLEPRALLLADESLPATAQEKAQARVDLWLAAYVRRLLAPLFELEAGAGLEGAARDVALRLCEALGVLERGRVAQEVKSLDQNARGLLRKLGVRFGAYYIYMPALVKPAIRVLATQLWALRQGGGAVGANLDEIPQLAASGRTSFLADTAISRETYRVAGFRMCGDRAVRVDIVERLADLIRPAVTYRPGVNAGEPPPGSADGDGFVVTGAMTSLTGCSGEQFASVLRALGYASERVKGPALSVVPRAPILAAVEAVSDVGAVDIAAPAEEGAALAGSPTAAEAHEAPPPGLESVAPAEAVADVPAVDNEVAILTEPYARESAALALADAAPEEPAAASVNPPADLTAGSALPDAEAEQSEGGAAASTAAPAEEPLIEVWRPRPPVRRRPQHGGAAKENVMARRPTEGSEGHAPDRRGDRGRNRRRGPVTPDDAKIVAAPAAEAQPTEESAKEESAKFRRGRGPRGPSHPSNGRDNANAGRRRNANPGGTREDRAQEDRKRDSAPPTPPRREPPVNMNSPFAKLLALKTQLETKGKGG